MTEDKFSVPCDICGEDIPDGKDAYATTTGSIEELYNGFAASDTDPWLTVACKKCGGLISDLICRLKRPEKGDRGPKLLVPLLNWSPENKGPFHLTVEITSQNISIECSDVETSQTPEICFLENDTGRLALRAYDNTQEDPVITKKWERRNNG